MSHENFDQILGEMMEEDKRVLSAKKKEYASGKSRYHNFDKSAAVLRTTPVRALLAFAAKHVVSIYDWMENGIPKLETVSEKLGDARRYFYLAEALIRDRELAQPECGSIPQKTIMFDPVGMDRVDIYEELCYPKSARFKDAQCSSTPEEPESLPSDSATDYEEPSYTKARTLLKSALLPCLVSILSGSLLALYFRKRMKTGR
jgi:hypothetical protein